MTQQSFGRMFLTSMGCAAALAIPSEAMLPPQELLVSVTAASPVVREAVLNAMPWDLVMEGVYGRGEMQVMVVEGEAVEPIDVYGLDADRMTKWSRFLLEKAGFYDGLPLVVLLTVEGELRNPEALDLLRERLGEAGIRAQVEPVPPGEDHEQFTRFSDRHLENPELPAVLWARVSEGGWRWKR